MSFSFLPAEVKFYDYFERATANLIDGARALSTLLDDYKDVQLGVDHIQEIEHRGDSIVHEVTNLLPRTLITPIDGDDIQRLISAVDDALDSVHAAADLLIIYQITEVKEPARKLAHLILEGAQELDAAMRMLQNKKNYDQVHERIVQINTLENDGDQILRRGIAELVTNRVEIFDLIRWKEIYELLEATTDRIEDAGDILTKVMIANA